MSAKCSYCGNDFIPSRPDNIYCSKECRWKKSRERNAVNHKKHKKLEYEKSGWNLHLKKKFGITTNDYNKMFQKQKGRCAICGRSQSEFKRRLSIDHSHKTRKIRGLLCMNCNRGIGYLKENKFILIKAIKYLSDYNFK